MSPEWTRIDALLPELSTKLNYLKIETFSDTWNNRRSAATCSLGLSTESRDLPLAQYPSVAWKPVVSLLIRYDSTLAQNSLELSRTFLLCE
jgi:hypothetical protein